MRGKAIYTKVLGLAAAASLVLLLGMSGATEPTGEEQQIRWKPGFRLTWDHFQGHPERGSEMDALTESGITYSWSCDWRGFHIDAYAIFVPTGSWVREPTSYLLAHEQAHFDITELHARKLRKYFATHPDPCKLGKAAIDKAAQSFMHAGNVMQNLYDQETRHGENRAAQREWLTKIATELEALAEYAE